MYDHYIYNSYDEVQYIVQRCELQKDIKFTVSVYLTFFGTLALYAPIATA